MNHVPHLIRVGLEIVEFVHSFEFEVVNVFPALVVNNPSAMCALGKPYLIEGGLMKTRNTITKLITMTLAALVAAELLCGGGLLQPVKAQTGDGSVKFVSYASIGIVHGQKVRLSVANNEESGGTLSLSFSFYLAHGSNASSVGSGIK